MENTKPVVTEPPKTKPLERSPLLEINYYSHGQVIKVRS